MKLRDNSTLIYIFLTALAVRLIYVVFFFGLNLVPDPDSVDYINYAKHLVAGLGYTDGVWKAFRAPGYPVFIAAVFSVFGESIPALKLAQTVISALVPVLVYLIGLRVTGRKAAVISGFFGCFYFGFIYEPGHIISESTFTFLFALSILLLLDTQKGKAYAVAAGAALALAALTRPVGLLIPPLVVIWLFLKFPAKAALNIGAIGVLTFTAIMAPWWARNYRTFGVFVPVCLETGFVLKGAHVPAQLYSANDYLPELARDRQNLKEGMALVRAETPLTIIKDGARNLLQFLYPFLPEYDLTYVLIFPLWLFGVYFVLMSKNIQALPLLTMFIYFPVAFAFFGTTRYRHTLGPYFILLAAIGAEELLRRAKNTGREYAVWSAAALWAGLNIAIFIYSEPVRLLVKRMAGG